jgi:hypothetical protein
LDNDFKLKDGKLYNLASDREEKVDLASEHPERMAAMKDALAKWQSNVTRSLCGDDYVQAAKNEAAVARATDAPEKIAVEEISSFAFDLYARLATENTGENLFFSPYSISTALPCLGRKALCLKAAFAFRSWPAGQASRPGRFAARR